MGSILRPYQEDDDRQIQRKLHLFQAPSIQLSMRRLWDLLPTEGGRLGMDCYVELNLRLQKCLTADFVLDKAVDSALGDWVEDVQEGQTSMAPQEFAMFIFELCSLWCGPSVSLRVYLFFLSSVFIAITEARGAHTSGLKPLDSIGRLPTSFFELVSLMGWAVQPEDNGESEERIFHAWFSRNLTPESEQAAKMQAQRQTFQVTHDVRSVFLFPDPKEKGKKDSNLIDMLRISSQNLSKVARPSQPAALSLQLKTLRAASSGPVPGASNRRSEALCLEAPERTVVRRPRDPRALPDLRRPQDRFQSEETWDRPAPLPGRAFATQLVPYKSRGLALAGQNALARPAQSSSLPPSSMSFHNGNASEDEPAEAVEEDGFTENQVLVQSSSSFRFNSAVESVKETDEEHGSEPARAVSGEGFRSQDYADEAEMIQGLMDGLPLPPYQLPRSPRNIYHHQTNPLMRIKPTSVIYDVNMQDSQLPPPFERVLSKLSKDLRPLNGAAPLGPLAHPSEPIWFEMQHRLEAILKKQGRRAERKRRRRLRAKLQKGRPAVRASRPACQDLREYLDRATAERQLGVERLQSSEGQMRGEFLGKVHERYITKKPLLEAPQRFQVKGLGGKAVDQPTFAAAAAAAPPPLPAVVRPVYMPPPGARTMASR